MILWYIGAPSNRAARLILRYWRLSGGDCDIYTLTSWFTHPVIIHWEFCESVIRLWGNALTRVGDNALIRFTNFVLMYRAAKQEFLSVSMTTVVATVCTWASVAPKPIWLTPLREGRVAFCSCIGRIRHLKAFALLSSSARGRSVDHSQIVKFCDNNLKII